MIKKFLAPEFGVVKSCQALGIRVSTYYYKAKENTQKDEEDKEILEEICAYLEKMPQSGYRPVTAYLKKKRKIGKKRVSRLMRQNGLSLPQKRKSGVKTTNSRHSFRKHPNLFPYLEKAKELDKVLVSDITYFDIAGKTHYLALIMALRNREVVGWAVSEKIDTNLALEAFRLAQKNIKDLTGFVHHSDSDSRYCSHDYIKALEEAGMLISMCKGNAYENAYAESLNGIVKRQEININQYGSILEARHGIARFLKYYHTIRPHSALGGLSPIEYKKAKKIEE